MKKLLPFLLLLSLTGCAALGKVNQTFTSQKNPVLSEAVSAALTVVISKAPNPTQTAKDVKAVATAIYADAASPTTTVATIEADLNTEILKVAKTDAERIAFVKLATQLETVLNAYIATNPGGPVVSTTLVSIQGVALAVEAATAFFGA